MHLIIPLFRKLAIVLLPLTRKKLSPNILNLFVLQTFGILCNCTSVISNESTHLSDSIDTIESSAKRIIKVNDLTQDQIKRNASVNSCYLPLLNDPSLYPDKRRSYFSFNELMNDSLKISNEFRNRYLVGDYMTLDENQNSRAIYEKNPILKELYGFEKYDSTLYFLFDNAQNSSKDFNNLKNYIVQNYANDSSVLLNFYYKIWQYKTPPLSRNFSYSNGKYYAAGQRICLCEAHEDTLRLIAQFAASSKRFYPSEKKDSLGNVISTQYLQSLPVDNSRSYYAALYRITSKNWEKDRKYEELDRIHDESVGGGNNRITIYKSRVELPNFMLMSPSKEYPKATKQNGIHEVALSGLSRGMLGTPNSIGCIRVTDFASKFIRYWSPQNVPFFVLYDEKRYFKELPKNVVKETLPFKNEIDGNKFREWLCTYKPLKAKQLNIDPKGKHDNGFILDAYNIYASEYEEYKTKQNYE